LINWPQHCFEAGELEEETGTVTNWGDSTRRGHKPASTLTVNRWTPTRKAAVILDLLRGGEAGSWPAHMGSAKPNCLSGGIAS
jgi:hypothetical protein